MSAAMTFPSISVISTCTALIATIVGPYVSIVTARGQINASVISINRAKWIDTVRELIALAVSQLTAFMIIRASLHERGPAAMGSNPMLVQRIEEGTLTNFKIRLLLNPQEPENRELIDVLDAAVRCLRSHDEQAAVEKQLQSHITEIMRLSHSILKREWIRVKQGT